MMTREKVAQALIMMTDIAGGVAPKAYVLSKSDWDAVKAQIEREEQQRKVYALKDPIESYPHFLVCGIPVVYLPDDQSR